MLASFPGFPSSFPLLAVREKGTASNRKLEGKPGNEASNMYPPVSESVIHCTCTFCTNTTNDPSLGNVVASCFNLLHIQGGILLQLATHPRGHPASACYTSKGAHIQGGTHPRGHTSKGKTIVASCFSLLHIQGGTHPRGKPLWHPASASYTSKGKTAMAPDQQG